MATCSYLNLVRYDNDDCTRKCRARSIDDIRYKARETLNQSRYYFKVRKMLDNRPSLADLLFDNDCASSVTSSSSHELDAPSEASSSQFGDHTFEDDSDDWPSNLPDQLDFSDTSSTPCATLSSCHDNVPAYFFEMPEPSRRGQTSRASKQFHQLYKGSSGANKNRHYCDYSLVQQQFADLKARLSTHSGDADQISQVIFQEWQIILNAMKCSDPQLVEDVTLVLKSLASDNLLQPRVILHMLQHGLVLNSRDSMFRFDNGIQHTVELFLTLARSTPASIPYMVDLMSNLGLLTDLAELSSRNLEDSEMVIDFFYFVTETMFSHLHIENQNTQQQLLVPDILLITGLSRQMLESFSPVSTLCKCISTQLIRGITERVLNRTFHREDTLLSRSLMVLANILKLIHFITATGSANQERSTWIARLLAVFRDIDFDKTFEKLSKGFDRLVLTSNSSEHCSQGVGAASNAVHSREQCQQFLSFYKDQYAALSPIYENLMGQWEVGYQTPPRDPLSNFEDSWSMED